MDKEQEIQDEQYSFPYHYIPTWSNGFQQNQYWSWGYRYLGGLKVVLDQLEKIQCNSLIDVGCGDGRFLRELHKKNSDINMLGIDYSKRAIAIAKALNPEINFGCRNIAQENLGQTFDVVTLIEVLEHIQPDRVKDFIASIAGLLNSQGKIILTVPHVNVQVSDKHYQHFDSMMLSKLFQNDFNVHDIIPIDGSSKMLGLFKRFIGGKGNYYAITNKKMGELFYTFYTRNYLYCKDETKCRRIALIAEKK